MMKVLVVVVSAQVLNSELYGKIKVNVTGRENDAQVNRNTPSITKINVLAIEISSHTMSN